MRILGIILKRFDNIFQLIEEKIINDTFAKTTNHRKNFNITRA